MLSILIPVFNAEKYLSNLLDTIIEQDRGDIEIVLLDDGSVDNSLEICRRYQNEYGFVSVISRDNKGTVRTRRELFTAAKGEWIWIIDSDDNIVPDALDFIRGIISNEQCDMILFDHYEVSNNRRIEVRQLSLDDNTVINQHNKELLYSETLASACINPLWNKVFRRECVDWENDYAAFEDVKKANDCLQMLPIISNANRIVYRKKPLYYYNRNNNQSISHKFEDYTITSLEIVWNEKEKYLKQWGMWSGYKQQFYAKCCNAAKRLLEKCIQSGKSYREYKTYFKWIVIDSYFSKAIKGCNLKSVSRKERVVILLLKGKVYLLLFLIFKYIDRKKRKVFH